MKKRLPAFPVEVMTSNRMGVAFEKQNRPRKYKQLKLIQQRCEHNSMDTPAYESCHPRSQASG